MTFVVFGVIGTLIAGIIIDKTKAFLFALRFISTLATLSLISSIWIVPYGNFYLTLVLCTVLGFAMCPILPVGFSFSVFLTHPIPPAVSNGLLMMGAQIFSITFTLLGAKLLLIDFTLGALMFCILSASTIFLAFCCIKEERKDIGDQHRESVLSKLTRSEVTSCSVVGLDAQNKLTNSRNKRLE